MPKDKVVVIDKELGLDSKGVLRDVNRHPGQNEVQGNNNKVLSSRVINISLIDQSFNRL